MEKQKRPTLEIDTGNTLLLTILRALWQKERKKNTTQHGQHRKQRIKDTSAHHPNRSCVNRSSPGRAEKWRSAFISSSVINIFARSPQSLLAACDRVCRCHPSACRASEFPGPLSTRGPSGPLRPPRQQPHPGTLRPAAGPPTPLPEEDASVRPQQRRQLLSPPPTLPPAPFRFLGTV